MHTVMVCIPRLSSLASRHFIWFGSLFVSVPAISQRIDSIPDYLTEAPKLIAKLDMRGSFISNEGVRIAGVKLGLEHAGKVQYGLGYSFLLDQPEGEAYVEGVGEVSTRLRFGYISPYFDYAFYRKNSWELRIPVQFGIGGGSVVYDDAEGRTQKLVSGMVILYEPCITVSYHFLKYFAVGGGWGFRLVLAGPPVADGLTAPIYTYGLRVFFGDLWRDLQP